MQPRAAPASQDDSSSLGCAAHRLAHRCEFGAITAQSLLTVITLRALSKSSKRWIAEKT